MNLMNLVSSDNNNQQFIRKIVAFSESSQLKRPRERGHWGDQDVGGRIILRWIFSKLEGVVGTGSWLRIGTGGGHLWVR